MTPRILPVLAISAITFAAPAWAADADRGAVLTSKWCSGCHVVSADQTGGDVGPPLYANPSVMEKSPESLRRAMLDPHPRMPDVGLSEKDVSDIIAHLRGTTE